MLNVGTTVLFYNVLMRAKLRIAKMLCISGARVSSHAVSLITRARWCWHRLLAQHSLHQKHSLSAALRNPCLLWQPILRCTNPHWRATTLCRAAGARSWFIVAGHQEELTARPKLVLFDHCAFLITTPHSAGRPDRKKPSEQTQEWEKMQPPV